MENIIYILVLVVSGIEGGLTVTNSLTIEGYTDKQQCISDLGTLVRSVDYPELTIEFAECEAMPSEVRL